jgi:hypothetical protein
VRRNEWFYGLMLAGMAGMIIGRVWRNGSEKVQVLGVNDDRKKWEEMVARYPDYRDGYVQLAINSLQLGDKQVAKKWMEKVMEIDPNYELSPILLEAVR